MCRTPFDPVTKQYFARLPYLEQKLLWNLEFQGTYTKLESHYVETAERQRTKRSSVSTFSRRSRYRMLTWLAKINWPQIKKGLFITLTYPDDQATLDPTERNKQRWTWHRDMENHLNKQFSLLWRIEWEPRKSGKRLNEFLPHFHLIAPGIRWIDKEKITSVWRRVIGADGPTSVKVKSLSCEKVHALYVSKYCAKIPSTSNLDDVSYLNIRGRHWGFHRPTMIPMSAKVRFENIPISLVSKIQVAASEFTPYYDPLLDTGVAFFGKFGQKMASFIRKLALDEGLVPCLE